ncbi:MAG: restriction endonuclease subunit S [Opitutaceae bacterium]
MNKVSSFIKFGEIAEFRNGVNFGKGSHGKGCLLVGVPSFSGRSTPDWKSLSEINPHGVAKEEDYLKRGDILFVRSNGNKALVGRSLYIDRDIEALFSGFCIRARFTSTEVDQKFCVYYTKTKTFKSQISGTAGTSINNLNQGILSQVEIPFFPKPEQKKIAKALSTLDAKIELNNRINAELEAMAKLLYDYWFVQFDFPMTAAQATAIGQPELESQPYKASGGKMVFNKTLKREIPEGWEEASVGTLCTLNEKVWTDKTAPENLTYIDLANAKNGQIMERQDYAWADAPSRARRILRAGDTIVGTVRPGNRSFCMVPETEKQLTGSTGFAVLTPSKTSYREFNYLSLTSETNITRLTTLASGAAYPAVNPDVVASYATALPPEALIDSFHLATAKQFDLIQNHQKQNQELTELRDWLLPMLMNGQVTVGSVTK